MRCVFKCSCYYENRTDTACMQALLMEKWHMCLFELLTLRHYSENRGLFFMLIPLE